MRTGLAINPEAPVKAVLPYQKFVDQFTILSVRPDKQGGDFLLDSIGRVLQLRKLLPNTTIEVDGGVNAANIHSVYSAGADSAAVGAALSTDTEREFYKLQVLASQRRKNIN